jgi:sugar phosphate isomerase/epimerase
MKVHLGVKSDPIEARYSFPWLFAIMKEHGAFRLQLGSSFPTYFAADEYFIQLRRTAEAMGIRITSSFSSHREMFGFASGDPLLEDATRRGWERLIHVASLVGAGSVGSNAFLVLRDQPHMRARGDRCFTEQMPGILRTARAAGLAALTVEPMSSIYEIPSTPEDIIGMMREMDAVHAADPEGTVPLLLCGDISHGVADPDGRVLHDNWSLFELAVPWMREFHFKNTDAIFNSTFGFSPEERARGIVDLERLRALIAANAARFPAGELTGYLEIGGPKVGRDYTDRHLERDLRDSLEALRAVFG